MSWQEQLIADWNGLFVIKENRIIVKGYSDNVNVVVPSKMFPLANDKPYKIFCHYNTGNFEDGKLKDKVIQIFDAIDYKVGYCYQNSSDLYKKLIEYGVEAKTYVGWLFIGEKQLPLHHAFVVIDDNKVLDFGVNFTADDFKELHRAGYKPMDEMRKIMAELHLERSKKSHHEVCGFGKVDTSYTYVATECDSEIGRQAFIELRKAYPTHIAYQRGRSMNGATVLQNMIMNLEK